MGRIAVLNLLFFFGISLFFAGCGSTGFLEKDKLSGLHFTSGDNNPIIFHNTQYNFSKSGRLTTKTHFVLRVGKNSKSLPDNLMVYDGSVEKLISYNSRIIKSDGSTSNYSKGDLHKFSLSSQYQISESFLWFLPVDKELNIGDLVETIYEHEITLPQLGINYSVPQESGDCFNISCSINIPSDLNLDYKIINDDIKPIINVDDKEKLKSYLFEWEKIKYYENDNMFGKKRILPGVLASYPVMPEQKNKFTWVEFGNWYLDIIAGKIIPDESIKAKALEITAGVTSDLEKMNALFNYCQKNVRYEQVYLEKGEFIPNQCALILSRKYGDCKDYATLIYTLAQGIGLNPSLALCFRGRGKEEFYDIPVSQFNHLLVYYEIDGKDYWFDGTNRSGTPGITTTDLINQTAVVLEKNHTRTVKINEHPGNCMLIEGNLNGESNDLTGDLKIKLEYQYAVDFLFFDFVMGKNKMKNYISTWLMNNLNDLIEIRDLSWSKDEHNFNINVKCRIPNSITSIDNSSYISLAKIFNNLTRSRDNESIKSDLFYYPGYSSLKVDLKLQNLSDPVSISNEGYRLNYECRIDPGPFNDADKNEFNSSFRKINDDLNKRIKLIKRAGL
jgi:hypothetical protein